MLQSEVIQTEPCKTLFFASLQTRIRLHSHALKTSRKRTPSAPLDASSATINEKRTHGAIRGKVGESRGHKNRSCKGKRGQNPQKNREWKEEEAAKKESRKEGGRR